MAPDGASALRALHGVSAPRSRRAVSGCASENRLRCPAVDVGTSEWRRLGRLVVALVAGVLVLVALTGGAAGTSRLDECVGAGCEGDGVTPSTASEVPGRASGSTPACVHDARCGGAHGGGASGLNFAAVPAGLAVLVAARPQGAARRAADVLRSLLFGRQLYRPPRFA